MAQIALTTVFTPPASCFDNSYTLYGSPVYVKDVQVQSLECYPEGFRALWSLGEPFSPGVCPEPYVAASSLEGEQDETRVLCCPGSITAHTGELGCFAEVGTETELALPTGVVTVKGAMLAMHGILVAWASSDLSLLPAIPGSAATTHPIETSPNEQQYEASTTLSDYASPTSNAISAHTLTVTPLITITESTTKKAEPQISDPSTDATSVAQDALTPEQSPSSPHISLTSTSPSKSVSATPHSPHHLPPAVIAGISIGAAAGVAILAGLAASAVLFRRRRRRAKARRNEVDAPVLGSASECHEDKRRWSELSSSFGTASGRGSEQTNTEVFQADSRAVVTTISELE